MWWGINPLSLEHEGRSSIFYCARSFGIIGGTGRTIFDSLVIGGGGMRQLGESVENGRHGIQKRCNGAKNLERGQVKCTGTPMLGLPPVPSGDVAFFWYEVYSGLARIMLNP
jgi:hypothetical protein